MLKKIFCLIIIILLSIIVSSAYSQQAKKYSTGEKQTAKTDQRGTEQSPLVVKTINPPKTEKEAYQDKKDREEKLVLDWRLVKYTRILAIVAIFQFLAFVIQAFYLYKGFQATEKAANAAKDSADALTAVERAYLFVEVRLDSRHSKGIIGEGDAPGAHHFYEVIVTNHGKTPAILMYHNIFAAIFNNIDNNLPEFPAKPYYPVTYEDEIINSEKTFTYRDIFTVSEKDWQEIDVHEDASIICIGRIQYGDVFGVYHATGFRWSYYPNIKKFLPDKDPKRNYHT